VIVAPLPFANWRRLPVALLLGASLAGVIVSLFGFVRSAQKLALRIIGVAIAYFLFAFAAYAYAVLKAIESPRSARIAVLALTTFHAVVGLYAATVDGGFIGVGALRALCGWAAYIGAAGAAAAVVTAFWPPHADGEDDRWIDEDGFRRLTADVGIGLP
jgi:hypothetical protein